MAATHAAGVQATPPPQPAAHGHSVGAWLDWARVRLIAGSASPSLDAEVLLASVLDRSRSSLIGFPERRVTPERAEVFSDRVRRRAAGVPVAHLVGRREFHSLEFRVTPHTLVPRPETELLVDKLLERIEAPAGVLDAGTGCGAIALSIKHGRPGCRVAAVDRYGSALEVAASNGARLGLDVHWVRSHWFTGFAERCFDFIVSNPPYVQETDAALRSGDLRHEPRKALDGGVDGLECLREIIATAPRSLARGGTLLLEHGYDQARAVRELLAARGFRGIETHTDFSGHDRVSLGSVP